MVEANMHGIDVVVAGSEHLLTPVNVLHDAAADIEVITKSIRVKLNNMQKDVFQIGHDLLRAKEILGHGNFLPWLESEFSWSARSAQNFMNVAMRLGGKYESLSFLPVDALYKLAAPSTPDAILDLVVSKVQSGEKVSSGIVSSMVRKQKAIAPRSDRKKAESRVARTKPGDTKNSATSTSAPDDFVDQAFALLKAKMPPERLKRMAFLLERCDLSRLVAKLNEHLDLSSTPS